MKKPRIADLSPFFRAVRAARGKPAPTPPPAPTKGTRR